MSRALTGMRRPLGVEVVALLGVWRERATVGIERNVFGEIAEW